MALMQTNLVRIAALLFALAALPAPAADPQTARNLYDKVAPSLVAVQYTFDGERGRSELIGQGVVIKEEGVIMTSLALFPTQFPDEQMKDFKVILPGDEEKELDAVFLGRDERSDMAFVKTKEAQKWPAIQFEESPPNVGDPVLSIGLLPKEAGYKAFLSQASVSAVLRGPVPYILVSTDGLSTVGSPVFNAQGKAIGVVGFQQKGQFFLLNAGAPFLQNLNDPPRFFIPTRDFAPSLSDMPAGQPLKLPWLGAPLSGLKKDVAEYFNLKGTQSAQVGEVIPDSPAAKAGLKPSDKIVKVNGEALERGDDPDEAPRILLRKIRRMKVGDKLTFSVLREKDKPPVEIAVTLEEQPRQANLANRFFAEDLGMSLREVVFADTYAKRLPATTKGVTVAFVRQNSSAATAGLRNGDLIIEMNKTSVTDLDSFKKQYEEFRAKSPKELVVLVAQRDRGTELIKIEPPQ